MYLLYHILTLVSTCSKRRISTVSNLFGSCICGGTDCSLDDTRQERCHTRNNYSASSRLGKLDNTFWLRECHKEEALSCCRLKTTITVLSQPLHTLPLSITDILPMRMLLTVAYPITITTSVPMAEQLFANCSHPPDINHFTTRYILLNNNFPVSRFFVKSVIYVVSGLSSSSC